MKPALHCVALLALTACSPQAPSPEARPSAPEAPPAQAATAPAIPEYEFAFGFRSGKETATDKRIVRTQASPCGDLPIARVTSIPLEDAVLVADPVVEFDQAGKELAHWGKPNGADVLGLDGDRLEFATEDGAYWTDTKGAIERAGTAPADPGSEFLTSAGMFPCPALPTFPAAEGGQQCFRVNDAAGRQRLIALEGVCS